jgi:hypothetical protein
MFLMRTVSFHRMSGCSLKGMASRLSVIIGTQPYRIAGRYRSESPLNWPSGVRQKREERMEGARARPGVDTVSRTHAPEQRQEGWRVDRAGQRRGKVGLGGKRSR